MHKTYKQSFSLGGRKKKKKKKKRAGKGNLGEKIEQVRFDPKRSWMKAEDRRQKKTNREASENMRGNEREKRGGHRDQNENSTYNNSVKWK